MKTYEAMFVLDEARCNEDFDGVVNRVKTILTNHQAEILSCTKWDQRKLCYPIRRRQRATYLLVHFEAAPEQIAAIRAACYLASDVILRTLILVDEDGVTADIKPAEARKEESSTGESMGAIATRTEQSPKEEEEEEKEPEEGLLE